MLLYNKVGIFLIFKVNLYFPLFTQYKHIYLPELFYLPELSMYWAKRPQKTDYIMCFCSET